MSVLSLAPVIVALVLCYRWLLGSCAAVPSGAGKAPDGLSPLPRQVAGDLVIFQEPISRADEGSGSGHRLADVCHFL